MQQTRTLEEFLLNGTLPCVGRDEELHRLSGHWGATVNAQSLRAVDLMGEEGAGKSRLVQELSPLVRSRGGLILQARFQSGMRVPLSHLLTASIWSAGESRRLLTSEPDGSLPSLAAALRRICRLRPTLIALDDVHLITSDLVGELGALLDTLADEPLALLTLSRPTQAFARDVAAPFVVDRFELKGLPSAAIVELWLRLFAEAPETEVLEALERCTAGNPLAVRSALRAVTRVVAGGRREGDTEAMTERAVEEITRNVHLLIEGMTAYLTERELNDARSLALLGTTFSLEAAVAMLGGVEDSLEPLFTKGILARSPRLRTPLFGPASIHEPLIFASGLLHGHLADTSQFDVNRLAETIAAELPLYSVLPFTLLRRLASQIDLPLESIGRLIRRGLAIANHLDLTSEWTTEERLWNDTMGLFERFEERWEPTERRLLLADLLNVRLSMLRRSDFNEDYARMARTLLDVVGDPPDPLFAAYRLLGLAHLHRYHWRKNYEACAGIWEEVQRIVREHPEIRLTREFFFYLDSAASSAVTHDDGERLVAIERQTEEILALPEVDDEFRRMARHMVSRHFLLLFQTPEELRTRLLLLEELEDPPEKADYGTAVTKILLFEAMGDVDRLLEISARYLPKFRENGLFRSYYNCAILELCAFGAVGSDLGEIFDRAESLCREAPPAVQPRLRRNTAINLATTGVLRGENSWAWSAVRRFQGAPSELPPEVMVLLDHAIEPTTTEDLEDDIRTPLIIRLALALRKGRLEDQLYADLRERLERPVVRLPDVTFRLACARLFAGRRPAQYPPGWTPTAALGRAIPDALQWLAERRLSGYMKGLLDQASPYLSRTELRPWRTELDRIAAERSRETRTMPGEFTARISMFGRITVSTGGDETTVVRGNRLRTLLGLMVAAELPGVKLSSGEFQAICAGDGNHPRRARITTHMAVRALRGVLGQEAVITARSAIPRLDRARCRVDLLEVRESLDLIDLSLREGHILRAYHLIERAIDLSRGEVPFPALYDSLFETLREDMENRLRRGIITVSAASTAEGDPSRAETLLRRGLEIMPEDEEILHRLCETLMLLDKRIEAERLRLAEDER